MASDLKQRAVVARTKLALLGYTEYNRLTDESAIWYLAVMKKGNVLEPHEWEALGITAHEWGSKGIWNDTKAK